MEDPRRGASMPPGAAEIFAPSFPVTPPKACAALWYKRRRGDTELCGALAGCPLSRLAATASRLLALSVTATPCQLPQRGSQVGSSPEACRKPSLASPFGGRWCPVGTVQRLVSAAASVGDGRSPLGCITRAGRRECPRRGRRGPTKSCPPAEDRKSDKLSKNPGNMRAPQFVP